MKDLHIYIWDSKKPMDAFLKIDKRTKASANKIIFLEVMFLITAAGFIKEIKKLKTKTKDCIRQISELKNGKE